MTSQYDWCSYCSTVWNFDNQYFWHAHRLYYSTSVDNYGGTFGWVTNWTLPQVWPLTSYDFSSLHFLLRLTCWTKRPSRSGNTPFDSKPPFHSQSQSLPWWSSGCIIRPSFMTCPWMRMFGSTRNKGGTKGPLSHHVKYWELQRLPNKHVCHTEQELSQDLGGKDYCHPLE